MIHKFTMTFENVCKRRFQNSANDIDKQLQYLGV